MSLLFDFVFNILKYLTKMILTMISNIFHILQQKPPYDANKLYCSEILSILLQNTEGKNINKSVFFSGVTHNTWTKK